MPKILLALILLFLTAIGLHSQTLIGTTFRGGTNETGTVSKFIADSKDLSVQKSFDAGTGFPAYPGRSNLIQAPNGLLYGMTTAGGKNGYGVLFSFDPGSSTLNKLKEFDYTNGALPFGSLVEDSNGKLFGMTYTGGAYGFGTIFSFDPSTSDYTILEQFDSTNGAHPMGSLIQGSDGKFYGMTQTGGSSDEGVLFSFDIANSTYSKLKDFDTSTGMAPIGNLLQASNGILYGMTPSGGSNLLGTIFSFSPSSNDFIKLRDLDNAGGGSPYGSLIEAADGKLYGAAAIGGANNQGVLFSFDPASSFYSDLWDFDNYADYPAASLFQASDGNLYGVAEGGFFTGGIIFSFSPSQGLYNELWAFDYVHGSSGGSLLQSFNGKLYGLAPSGGGGDNNGSFGLIYSFDITNLQYTIEKAFASNQTGSNASGGLIRAKSGKLLGMTTNGGSGGWGVIYSLDPISLTYTKLKDFDYSNGSHPYGTLIEASDGKFYGLTANGGDQIPRAPDDGDIGVLFSYDPASGALSKLMRFDNRNSLTSSNPYGSLVQGNDGNLYGMTSWGGGGDRGYGQGAIFSYNIADAKYTRLRDFLVCTVCADPSDSNGISPYGSFVQASDGKLYGMTSAGGNYHFGVLFSYEPASAVYTKLVDFDSTNGANPYGSLILARDGKLYGMTYGGGSSDAGVIFSYDPLNSNYSKLKDFDFVNGSHPYGNLMQASDGKLYGMTSGGGLKDYGVIFSFDPVSSAYLKLMDYDGSNGATPYFGSAFIELGEPIPTPVTDINNLEEFKVFPNPNNGLLFVKMKLNSPKDVAFSLFNLVGQIIYQSPTYHFSGEQIKKINQIELAGGVYLLQTRIGDKSFTRKIIITR